MGYWVPVEAHSAGEWEFVSTSEIRATLGKLEEEAAWRKAEAANTILSYYYYNRRYPSGKYRDQAL